MHLDYRRLDQFKSIYQYAAADLAFFIGLVDRSPVSTQAFDPSREANPNRVQGRTKGEARTIWRMRVFATSTQGLNDCVCEARRRGATQLGRSGVPCDDTGRSLAIRASESYCSQPVLPTFEVQ